MTGRTKRSTVPPNEIAITRLYDAPVKLVWEAWTDPRHLARWWGPRGFTLTTHSKDLRPGGRWVYTMHGPDGADYPNIALYHEVEPYKRLVYDHGATEDRPPLFRVTVAFTDVGGKTQMDMRMALPTPEAAEETRKFIKDAGGNATWDRLAEYLEKERADREVFVINRSFAAPIETMYDLWTTPAHLARWLPPTGFTMRFIRADIRPGGDGFFAMTDGKAVTMYGRVKYLEMRRPDRLVYTQQFCDEHENVSRHPMMPAWPETMLTTVVFAEEGADQTRVTVTWEPHGRVTAEELETFRAMRGSMTQGWTGSFDKLDACVAGDEALSPGAGSDSR
ncbi:MAG: SRPBCC domain-containing protein [Gemmatimonadaceae bacterium]|nr:SRPBCC domain-containing protein [Gemmatimonadaceae bacterium]